MGKSPNHHKEHVTIPKWAQAQDRLARTKHYPGCRGTFPDCPETIQVGVMSNSCLVCPYYK